MATRTPTLTPRDPARPARYGGGGLPPIIEFPHYGGDEGPRDDRRPDLVEQLRRYRLGMMIGLVAVTMLFVAFTATYMFRHSLGRFDLATGSYVNDWRPLRLPLALLVVNTLVLGLSSFTMEKARRAAFRAAVVAPITALPGIAADDREFPWAPVTAVLGMVFLAGQLLAWRAMEHRGFFLASGLSSSFFYVLTALHGIHLLGGIVALGYAALVTFRSRALERRRIVVDVTAWYWHFMGLLWAYIFALLLVNS
jgi:cytochrome c oxidase subunit 3